MPWTESRSANGTRARVSDKSVAIPRHTPPRAGPRPPRAPYSYNSSSYILRSIYDELLYEYGARGGRGPALGGVCLGIATDLSETRARVPFADRLSVHGMPVIAGWIELDRRYPTSYQRPPDSIVTSQERYKTTSILAFGVQAYADGRRDGVTEAFRSST